MSVDDEPIVHRMISKIIEESGLPLTVIGTAASGKEALKLASELQPQIFLLDIQMNEMNGLELAERLTENLDYKPRIIYLTAYGRFEYAQQAIKLGAADYVLKPIQRKELVAVLTRVVNEVQAELIRELDQKQIKEKLSQVLPAVVPASTTVQSRAESLARAARAYIDEHYAEPISLSDLADQLCLSPGYLGPIFKAATGLGFRAYLRSVRVARAKELMQDPKLNLTEIAQNVGYEDVNYFSQAFLEETGLRPSTYRGGGGRWAK